MQTYSSGQRWISETEPELGMGLVADVSARAVQVFFQAANEMRHYAINNAPLKRVRFEAGDEIEARDGVRLTVEKVIEEDGRFRYVAADGTTLDEVDLCDTSGFDRPETRLLGGHVDRNDLFELRTAALAVRHRYERLPVRGLLGGRVDLLPHQLYIAQEVSSRPLPRVLLADEVGLGKTIEASLVLHRLLVCGVIGRVLILVPHALIHQWFIELLRRFNLSFSIFDEERCAAIEAMEPGINPFHDDQLILSSIDFLTDHPERAVQAIACDWDLLIVDEAHHLHWTPEQASPEYRIVERLAGNTPRLLLLTASPEQMGLESHFARLRLLDPQRYPDFETYRQEHERYAQAAEEINQKLDSMTEQERAEALDRHGPGRVIFRNTRRNMTGFPKRYPHLIPLQLPEGADRLGEEDPRLDWLLTFLRSHPEEKVLVIGRTKFEVMVLVDALRSRSGMDVAYFHEKMKLVQCDRQAAWFAEPEGARVMVVSEMGGEGRNFQMASHLVLIDVPRDPELLEQRIGRLDRIGQRGDVHIHLPYLSGTEEEQVVRWLHEGLNAFAEPVAGGHELLERFEPQLDDVTDAVIAETRSFYATLREQITAGRDRLLELSSFRPDIGSEVARQIADCEESTDLKSYLLQVFEHYGVHAEALDTESYHIRPDQMFDDWFPLPADGMRITFNRDEALIRPDTTLMSWDHPLVTGAGELILGSERGSCAMAVDPAQDTPLKLQAVYVLETVAPPGLNANRFLPPTPLIFTVDHAGNKVDGASCSIQHAQQTCSAGTTEQDAPSTLKDAEPWKLLEHESVRQQLIPAMIEATRALAAEAAESIIADARREMQEISGTELKRLTYLRQINDNIREEELTAARGAIIELDQALTDARLRLDAVRIISAK